MQAEPVGGDCGVIQGGAHRAKFLFFLRDPLFDAGELARLAIRQFFSGGRGWGVAGRRTGERPLAMGAPAEAFTGILPRPLPACAARSPTANSRQSARSRPSHRAPAPRLRRGPACSDRA